MSLDSRGCFSLRRFACLLVAVAFVACGRSACHATMLNLTPQGSHSADITASFGSATYVAATDLLTVAGTATAIDYDQTAPPDAAVSSGGVGKPASFAISVHVSGAGALVGPATSTDLKIMGLIAGGPHPSPVYGTLLSGQAIKFGYANNLPNRLFEFVFLVTGGSQQAQFGPTVGVIFDSVSGFHGSFATNFTTSVSGNGDTFAVPEPASILLIAIGFIGAVGIPWCRRRQSKSS
jgi:PEP-CTERM motif